MTPRPNAVRIGLFTLGGMALLVATVGLLVGGRLFADPERAVMVFSDSVHGLQVGSPVVLRGVRLGSVRSIGLVHENGSFRVPVVVDIDRGLIGQIGSAAPGALPPTVPALVERGLQARLATQSLLTGQLYIDLALRPLAAPVVAALREGVPEIPTAPPLLQALQEQLEKLDIVGLTREMQATLADTRALIKGPEIRGTLAEMAQTAAALKRLSSALERRVPGLADGAQQAFAQAGQAAGRVGTAAERMGGAAARAEALLAPGSPALATLASVQQAADELTRSAAALRQASAGDAPTVQQLQQAMADIGRAARAVRQLAEMLEQQPEALIRGRSAAP